MSIKNKVTTRNATDEVAGGWSLKLPLIQSQITKRQEISLALSTRPDLGAGQVGIWGPGRIGDLGQIPISIYIFVFRDLASLQLKLIKG